MTARSAMRAAAWLVALLIHTTAAAQTPQVRIVPTDGQPQDSVTLGQSFEIRATMPGANPPPTVTVRLTTPSGSTKDVTLHRIGTENGVATYGTGTVESIGGSRNARLVASSVHQTTGTINDLALSNGEMVTAQIVGANGGPMTGGSASIPVYDNEIEQGIARNREMLDAIGESLVMQRNEANAVMTDANAPDDVRQEARQARDEIDAKLRQLGNDRQAIERLQTPLAKLRMGNKAVTGLTRTDEVLDLSAPITDRDVIQDNMISLATAATLATYKILSDLTLSGAFYKAGQGFVSFAMNEYWMNKFFGPKLKGLRDRMAGSAIDEFGRPITAADQRRAVGEIALSFFMMAKFPKFMDWLSDGRPADIRIPGARPTPATPAPRAGTTGSQPPVAGAKPAPDAPPRPGTTGDKTQVFPETGNTRQVSPGRRYTPEEQAAHEADEIAENVARYEGNLKAARDAGVSADRIKAITGKGKHGDPDVADELGREALKAQGKELDMPLGEYTRAKMFETRNRLRTLTEDDYDWLRNRLAEDPQYLDKLPNRGRMLDDFDAAITPAQRDDLLQNPRVRTMVDEAKANPAAAADGTPTQRLPATEADATPTVKLPAQGQAGARPQTGGVDPNATQRTGPPTAATNPDGTPTVRIPPPVADPGATTIITRPPTGGAAGGATQRMPPPNAATNPDATPTVKIPPPVADPGATTIITRPPTGGTGGGGSGGAAGGGTAGGGAGGGTEPTTIGVIPGGGFTPAPSVPPIDFYIAPGASGEDDLLVTGGFTGTVIDLANDSGTGVITAWGGGRNAAVQIMIIDAAAIRAEPLVSRVRGGNALAARPRFGLREVWASLRRLVTREPVRARRDIRLPDSTWRETPAFTIDGPAQRSAEPRPAVKLFLSSLGVSTGEAFEARAINEGAVPVELSGDGLVVEPLDQRGQSSGASELRKAASKAPAAEMLNAYCLEFLRQPPTAGTLFRIASPELQRRFAPMRRILQAARKLQQAGLLKPDSTPADYFHSIRQWSLWSREQGFDVKSFGKAFIEHTKKNFTAAGRQWTRQIEDAVLSIVPGRWSDIVKVLEAADAAAAGAD